MLIEDKIKFIQNNQHRLITRLNELELKNPIMPASGCCGFGEELNEFYDIENLGALMIKSTTSQAREGNSSHRIYETENGMLNSIGLQNPGVAYVIEHNLPWLAAKNATVIINLAGSDIDSYVYVAKELEEHARDMVLAIELNVSCPNVSVGGIQFGSDPDMLLDLIEKLCAVTTIPVFVKLSPNVTNIKAIASVVDKSSAYGITMINTLVGMAIDYKTGKPIIANKIAGYSGPAIKPVALKQIYEVYQVTNKPIIGMGGITSAYDVVEFLAAGSSACAIGTANFNNPYVCIDVLYDLINIMDQLEVENISELIGRAHE